MYKTPEKVTKDPKRVEQGRKPLRKRTLHKKMKEDILKNVRKGSGDTTNSSNETISSTNNSSNETTSPNINSSNETTSVTNTATTRPNDTYVYGGGIIAVVAIGVCVVLHITLSSLKRKSPSRKNRINHHDVICFRSCIINE